MQGRAAKRREEKERRQETASPHLRERWEALAGSAIPSPGSEHILRPALWKTRWQNPTRARWRPSANRQCCPDPAGRARAATSLRSLRSEGRLPSSKERRNHEFNLRPARGGSLSSTFSSSPFRCPEEERKGRSSSSHRSDPSRTRRSSRPSGWSTASVIMTSHRVRRSGGVAQGPVGAAP